MQKALSNESSIATSSADLEDYQRKASSDESSIASSSSSSSSSSADLKSYQANGIIVE